MVYKFNDTKSAYPEITIQELLEAQAAKTVTPCFHNGSQSTTNVDLISLYQTEYHN